MELSAAARQGLRSTVEGQKARLFAITQGYAGSRESAAAHRERLQEAAGLVPGVAEFCRWCLEDVKAAWLEDRERGTRSAKNRRLAWLHLFRYFARLHRIERDLEIRALDRQGNYACELVEREPQDRWGQLVRLAREFGIRERDLIALAEEAGTRAGEGEKREAAQA